MKVNELRYGNKLLFLGEVVTFESIGKIRKDGVFWIKTTEVIESKSFHFKPIPLTDEWKIKFGGVKKGVEWQFKIGEFTTCFEETPEGFFYTGGEGVSLSRNIEFVHDFQNIVYAIEGIEIQINQSAK